MPRMTHAKYPGEKLPISALYVDQYYNNFDRRLFTCYSCEVQIQFSRGKDHKDPHFKNWPNVLHKDHCEISDIHEKIYLDPTHKDVQNYISTILKRAMSNPVKYGTQKYNNDPSIAKHYTGLSNKKFIYTISDLLDPKNKYSLRQEFEYSSFTAEDGSVLYLKDVFGTQDQAILRHQTHGDGPFILKGATLSPRFSNGNYIISLSKSGKYGNINDFKLFISKDYAPKNINSIDSIANVLFICYGFVIKNRYGYQMNVYSINHQLAIIDYFNKSYRHQ